MTHEWSDADGRDDDEQPAHPPEHLDVVDASQAPVDVRDEPVDAGRRGDVEVARREVAEAVDPGLDDRNRRAVDEAAWAASVPADPSDALPSHDLSYRPVAVEDATARTTPNRIDLADDVPEIELKPTFDGYLDLVAHGDATGTQAAIDGDRRDLTLAQTADLIRESPSWQERPIRLLSCKTGAASFAQDLATDLKVPVYAPTTDVEVYADGRTTLADGGSWRRFEPRWYD